MPRKNLTKKVKLLGVGLLVSLILNVVLLGKSWLKSEEEVVSVTKVVDGDTFDVSSGERIRIYGIDAPEYPKGCLSKKAKARVEELVLGKEVVLGKTGEYSFERVIATAMIDNLDIAKVMVTEGLASVSKISENDLELEKAGEEAIKAKRGIWSSECTAEREGCEIKGNFHQGTKDKVYHVPGCYNYNQVNINPNEGDRWFCTDKEAEEAGFKRANDCPGDK